MLISIEASSGYLDEFEDPLDSEIICDNSSKELMCSFCYLTKEMVNPRHFGEYYF